jgi:hypothetical protein
VRHARANGKGTGRWVRHARANGKGTGRWVRHARANERGDRMTDAASPPGPLIGSGRAADVYALDSGQVLRRYRTAHSCAAEAGLMSYLRGAGYPVPEVFAADGTDLVMQRLHGRDMLADLAR